MLEEIWLVILAGVLGGATRSIFGFLGEAEPDESFSVKKAVKSILRATIGGGVLAYFLALDPKGTFFAAFVTDFTSKAVWDIIQAKKETSKPSAPGKK